MKKTKKPGKKLRALALISGGIDSPVAAWLMLQKGLDLIPVYFDNYPFAGEDTRQRALDSARHVGFREIVVVPHGRDLKNFAQKCGRKYACVLCRRMMLRVSERLAKKLGAQALVTGESLAQVASQTLQNLATEYEAIKIPIMRPLIGLDKEEIIRIAKQIGSYSVSTRPAMCCAMPPQMPSTRARIEKVLCEEEKLSVKKLVEWDLKHAKHVKL